MPAYIDVRIFTEEELNRPMLLPQKLAKQHKLLQPQEKKVTYYDRSKGFPEWNMKGKCKLLDERYKKE